jgi:hypothetical protein
MSLVVIKAVCHAEAACVHGEESRMTKSKGKAVNKAKCQAMDDAGGQMMAGKCERSMQRWPR